MVHACMHTLLKHASKASGPLLLKKTSIPRHNLRLVSSTSPPARVVEFLASEKGGTSSKGTHTTVYTSNAASNHSSWITPPPPITATTTVVSSNVATNRQDLEEKHNNLNSNKRKQRSAKEQIMKYIQEDVILHFLPADYPNSVAPGYGRFASLCFCGSVCGSAAMVLSTQTLLLAVGIVGSTQQASIMAGALNWVLKDGIGQLGGVWFASRMGRTGSGKFDADPKRWRMVAAISTDGATLLEILTPLLQSTMVLPIASIANISKNIGFLTASASRAALHQSLALSGNLADVTVKAGSQNLVASLLGTALGIGLSPVLVTVPNYALGFVVLSGIHQGCTYQSLKAVPLLNLNRHRLHLLLSHFVTSRQDKVLSPAKVAQQESFLPFLNADDSHLTLTIGSDLKTLCPGGAHEFNNLQSACPNEQYLLNTHGNMVHLVFLEDAKNIDLLRGMLHAYLFRANQEQTHISTLDGIATAHEILQREFHILYDGLEKAGWKTETGYVSVESINSYRLRLK